jgi:hypothetical protein
MEIPSTTTQKINSTLFATPIQDGRVRNLSVSQCTHNHLCAKFKFWELSNELCSFCNLLQDPGVLQQHNISAQLGLEMSIASSVNMKSRGRRLKDCVKSGSKF